MKLLCLFLLLLSFASFKNVDNPPLQVSTRSYHDTLELIISYQNMDTPLVIKRFFRPNKFCLENIYIRNQLTLSSDIFYRRMKEDSSFYSATETNYLNNKPVLTSSRHSDCSIRSWDIYYRSFQINDSTDISLEYFKNGYIENCELDIKDQRIYKLEFDSTNTTYQFGYFNDAPIGDTIISKENGDIFRRCWCYHQQIPFHYFFLLSISLRSSTAGMRTIFPLSPKTKLRLCKAASRTNFS